MSTPGAPGPFAYWLWNGRLIGESEVALSPWDRGFRFGDGVYETVRVHRGLIYRLDEHLRRMATGLGLLEIELEPATAFPDAELAELVAAAQAIEGRLRLTVTRGAHPGPAAPPVPAPAPTRLAALEVLAPTAMPSEPRPLHLATVTPPVPRPSAWSNLKSLNHLPYVLAAAAARRAGAEDGLLTVAGHIKETTSANVFVVRGDVVATPPTIDGLLAGVTRDLAIELAREAGARVEERPVAAAEIARANEIFVTGSVTGIRPVASVDGRSLPAPIPGAMTARIRDAYAQRIAAACGR